MKHFEEQDSFLSKYKEWISHIHNPFYYTGTLSDFTLYTFKNKKRYNKLEGIPILLWGLFMLLILIGVSVMAIAGELEIVTLFFTIPFCVLSLLFIYRGAIIILGVAPDMKDDSRQ